MGKEVTMHEMIEHVKDFNQLQEHCQCSYDQIHNIKTIYHTGNDIFRHKGRKKVEICTIRATIFPAVTFPGPYMTPG